MPVRSLEFRHITPSHDRTLLFRYSMMFPSNFDLQGEDLAQIILNKETTFVDLLDSEIVTPQEFGEDDPWRYQHRVGNRFRTEDVHMGLGFDPVPFQVSEKESKFMPVTVEILMQTVWRTLESAGIPLSLLHKTRTGVFVAAMGKFGDFISYPDETAIRSGIVSGLSDRIAYFLGTHGPTLTFETACSSSLVAMTLAVKSIRDGSCDVAIVSAINCMNAEYDLALQATGVVSAKGQCRPFSEDASGTLRCEGSGGMVICSLEWAKKNGYAETIKSVIVNSTMGSAGADPNAAQGSGRVYESPNVYGMVELIRLCHKQVGLPLERISYVEAHATGTKVGDLIELQALGEVYSESHDIRQNPLRIGSIKGTIGHAEMAAGLFSLIKAVEMIRSRKFFPTGGCDIIPRTDYDWDGNNIHLLRDVEPFPPNEQCYIGVNSFGIGGSYAHTIITEYDGGAEGGHGDRKESSVSPLLLTLSAASVRHLILYEEKILDYLRSNPGEVDLLDICGLFAVNRPRLVCSRSYIVHSIEDLMTQLDSESKSSASDGVPGNTTLAMVFTGQGSQWVGMGSGLMVFKAFRDVVTRFDALYKKLSGWSPLAKLNSLNDDQLDRTMYAQPLTFMVQAGLVELLAYLGVRADVAVGHSAGEIAALYCSGILSLEDAASVVWHRSFCQEVLAGNGRMLAVQLGIAEAKAILRDASLDLSSCEIACINSPSSVVLAGRQSELERVKRFLSTEGVKSKLLKGQTAFHCSLMDPILSEVDSRLEFLNRRTAKGSSGVSFLSTVSARKQTSVTSEYIVHNIRHPVRFHETIELLLRSYEPDVIIELGPHKTLAPLLVECAQAANQRASVLSSLSNGDDDIGCFWSLIRGMQDAGVSVDLATLYKDLGYRFSRVAETGIPRHPMIPRESAEKWIGNSHNFDLRGMRDIGPAAGTLASQDTNLVSVVEISKATSSAMTEHVMGGIAMLPGAYFLEAAIELWGMERDTCLSITDLVFHEMCPIPDRSKTQTRNLFVRHSADKSSKLSSFTVDSRPIHGSDTTVHCTGEMASFPRPHNDVLDGSQFMPGIKGTWKRIPLTRDIGQDGIRNILESHELALSGRHFYDGMVNIEGVAYYGPSFQVIKEVRVNLDRSRVVATLQFDHEQWSRRGGVFGVQLIDGIFQLCFLNPFLPSGNVSYAGGFDWGVFLRSPVDNRCIVDFQFSEDEEAFGQTIVHGDAIMYDPNGRIICHIMGIRSILGKRETTVVDAVPVWQPLSMGTPAKDGDADPTCDPDRTSAVVSTIASIVRRKHALLRGEACHVRVFEFWEDCHSVPSVFEALASVNEGDMPEDFRFLVEVFVATHDESVMKKGYYIPHKHKHWLKLRLVSMPSGQAALTSICFDVIVRMEAQGRWKDPMEFLKYASGFGYDGSLVIHDFDPEQASQAWEGCVGHWQALPGGLSSCSMLLRALVRGHSENISDEKTIFIVSKDVDLSCRLGAALEEAASKCSVRVNVSVRSIRHEDLEATSQLADDVSCAVGERHVVILDGVVDESEYAQDTFALSARIAAEVGPIASCFLWLVTSNAFVPPMKVDRASIHPLVSIILEAYHKLRPKYVDLGGPLGSFKPLASLIMARPGPNKFMIDLDGVVYQRLVLPRGTACPPRKVAVRADNPELFYKLELVKPNRSTGRQVGYDFFARRVQRPEGGEVLVDIEYASLNFRDVMLTLNALPRSSMEASFYRWHLGMEASGKVAEVGPGVHHVAPGDQVMVSGKGSIASKVIASAGNVSKLDRSILPKDAACVSSVYTTAYHALVDLCCLRKGERVLIHAAAGGVGHAAISVCRHIGAEVFATASRAKRDYCIKSLGLQDSRVFNSRDVSWFHDLMRSTNGEGVDVILNSLAGEHQKLGMQCLKPGGRFIEIGKADIFSNQMLSLFSLRKNIRVAAVDMDRMALEDPGKLREISERVAEGLAQGYFKPLPYTCFPMDQVRDAMELMKSGAHIGKVLLSNSFEDSQGGCSPLTIMSNSLVKCRSDTYHLVLGGAGGFGARLVRWLFKKGARKFIITVRKDPSRVTRMFEDLIATGATFIPIPVDLSSAEGYTAIEKTVMGPAVQGQVESMIHCAGCWEMFSFDNVDDGSLKRQCGIKVQAALFLDQLSRKLGSVAHFILVGSASEEVAFNPLATYGASNAILGAIGRKRLSEGLPSTLLKMTTLVDVGMIARDTEALQLQRKRNVAMMNAACACMSIESMLSEGTGEMLHGAYMSPQEYGTNGEAWPYGFATPLADPVLLIGRETNGSGVSGRTSYEGVLERVIWILAESMMMGVAGDGREITASSSLAGLGIDSLGIVELNQELMDAFGYQIDRTAFAMTIGDLAKDVYQKARERDAEAAEDEGRLQPMGDINGPQNDSDDINHLEDAQLHQTQHIRAHYRLPNHEGYAVMCPGLTGGAWAYADWKLDNVQVLAVDYGDYEEDPKLIAPRIAKELFAGYLKDGTDGETPKCVLLGYSFGAAVALEICRELLDVYSFSPTGLVPVCLVAPTAWKSPPVAHIMEPLLPKPVLKLMAARKLRKGYQVNHCDETAANGASQVVPSIDTLVEFLPRQRAYVQAAMRDLERCRREKRKYIGGTRVHYVYALKDVIGNPSFIQDPMRHGWAELTSATVGLTRLYGNHACIMDPIQGPAARDCILDIVQGMFYGVE